MKKTVKKLIAVASTIAVLASVGGGLVACNHDPVSSKPDPRPSVVDADGKLKTATYNTYSASMPSNWNELSYQDNTDTLILNYIVSSFFEFDYKFEESKGGKFTEDGFVNKDAITDFGAVDIKYSAATALEDVTSTVDAKWGYTADQKATGGYAWKVTIRDDIKWDDGTPIDASDFVYSMKAMLDPDFLNVRANTYYERFGIINADYYIFSKQSYLYESLGKHDYATLAAAIADNADVWLDAQSLWGMNGAVKLTSFNPDGTTKAEAFVVDTSAPAVSTYMPYNEDMYLDPAVDAYVNDDGTFDTDALEGDGASLEDFVVSGKYILDYFLGEYGGDAFDPDGALGDDYVKIRVLNSHTEVNWEDVGFYQDGDYSFVVCMNKPIQCLEDDDSLSYHAAYEFQSLPLVKEDLYESCKKAPVAGSTLWTSNYNSSLETSASWGPYKLTAFQGGKSFTLERNENWFGYAMEDNKNQYNVTKIQCERIADPSTAWMSFLSGKIDDISVDKDHLEYAGSYYSTHSTGTGTFGLQVYSNLAVLNANGRNNSILAIDEFRQALSLSINRNDVVEKIWPVSAVPCYGVMNDMYTYDVSDMASYRKSVQGKTALLNAYGFTQGSDGKWSDGAGITNATLDDAYDALTGYNPTLAKQLLNEAYQKLTANATQYNYDSTKDIEIVYGASIDNDLSQFRCQYVQDVINNLTAGTPLAGKIKLKLDASQGDSGWADAFKNDTYDFFFGAGFTGNALDPFDMIGGFVDPTDSLNYHKYWDTTKENLTIKLPAGDYDQAGKTLTMTIKNWYDCLNGNAAKNGDTYTYNWAGGFAPADARLEILSSIEAAVLQKNYFIALIGESNTDLLGAKFSNFSEEYSLFNGFGSMRYMNVHYTDAEWDAYVSGKGGSLESEYKKTGD